MERIIDALWDIWYNIRLVPGYKYRNHIENAWQKGYDAASRSLEFDVIHPSMYDDGYKDALVDLLDDECFDPYIVEVRELLSKKERNANR